MEGNIQKVLVIHFKRHGDLFYSLSAIQEFKNKYPHCELHLLVYSEFERSASILNCVDKVHMVNRDRILTYYHNKLFSKSLAINEFTKNLDEVFTSSWDCVINLSNDPLACFLSSAIKNRNFIGTKINLNGTTHSSNSWAIYLNEIAPRSPYAPFSLSHTYMKMMGVDKCQARGREKLKRFDKNEELSLKNFNKIRSFHQTIENAKPKIIGIQIFSSHESKQMGRDEIIEFIKHLQKRPDFIPVILCAPIDKEREYCSSLNSQFENKLMIVEFDFKAAASVLRNLDILITPDTAIKHIADLCGTPILEVSCGYSPFILQGTTGHNNLILSQIASSRSFSTKKPDNQNFNISGSDVYSALNFFFNPEEAKKIKLSSNITLYQVSNENGFSELNVVAGQYDAEFEISINLSKLFLQDLFDNFYSEKLANYISTTFEFDDVKNVIVENKNEITQVTRSLLATLRNLKACREQPSKINDFIVSLDQLFNHADSKYLTSYVCKIFKFGVENIEEFNPAKSLTSIEDSLYKLKNDLQQLNNRVNQLLEKSLEARKQKNVDLFSSPSL